LFVALLCNKDLYIYICLCLTMTGILQAFRRLYEHVGLGWIYAITKYEPVSLPFIVLKDLLSCSSSMDKYFHYCLLKNKIAYIFIYYVINWEKNICRLLKLLILYMVSGLNTVFKLQVKEMHTNNFTPKYSFQVYCHCDRLKSNTQNERKKVLYYYSQKYSTTHLKQNCS